eukprot:309443-Chlamydomonas_euryale.AAC.1
MGDQAARLAKAFDSNFMSIYSKGRQEGYHSKSMGPTLMECNYVNGGGKPDLKAIMRERRLKNLCLYCGGVGHKVADCRVAPKKDRPGNGRR